MYNMDEYNILFYGNCQIGAIASTLCLCEEKYQTTSIPCFDTDIDEMTFLNHISFSDLIITQLIRDNYREKHYLSTSYIIKNARSTTKIIILDSCYFNFYYVDLKYVHIDGVQFANPNAYHHKMMIEYYKNKESPNKYIEDIVNNPNLVSKEELETTANNSLNELNKRANAARVKYKMDNLYLISIHDFVKSNYKEKLLFYSMNHPTKYVLQYLCHEIIKCANIDNTIDYNIDPLHNPKCILYACVQQNVNFDISKHRPLIDSQTDILAAVNKYYSAYDKIDISKL
jgi:hypothetical protein